jgi:uncharacterized SAM-binding protein YcdF (DUF218 family)
MEKSDKKSLSDTPSKKPFQDVKKLFNLYNLVALFFVFAIALWVINPIEKMASYLLINPSTIATADVAIVLSGGSGDRVEKAVSLLNQNKVRRLLMTGGPRFNSSEAASMKNYAISLGVPEDKISLEERAQSTYENATFTKPIIKNWGVKSIIVVTSDYHTRRSHLVFKNVYGDSVTLQTVGGNRLVTPELWFRNHEMSEKVLQEWGKIIIYKIIGYL